jgi:hypothetical protein
MYSNMTEYDSDRAVLNGLLANGVDIGLDPKFFTAGAAGAPHLATYSEYVDQVGLNNAVEESIYNNRIRNALATVVGVDSVGIVGSEKDTYNNLIKNPHPWQ